MKYDIAYANNNSYIETFMNECKLINTFIYIGPAYHKKPKWEECKANEVIYSEDICRIAADTLDLNYGGKKWESSKPKGCYWEYSSAYYNVGKGSSYIYDPDSTFEDSYYWGQRGGICLSKGKRFILTLLDS